MNCEEFEKSVLAQPDADSDDRRQHANACPDCDKLLVRVRKLERRLSALMAVPVPSTITGALPDMQTLEQGAGAAGNDGAVENVVPLRPKARRGVGTTARLALAASVALAALLVMRQFDVDAPLNPGVQLAESVIEHIGPELGAMRPVSTSVGAGKLSAVLTPAGATLGDDVALVSYAKSCVINGRLVPHLVMQGADGPVTVLLMPEERVDGPVSIMRDGLEGVILPVGDSGSIAIIGRDAASVEAVRERALAAVSYTT